MPGKFDELPPPPFIGHPRLLRIMKSFLTSLLACCWVLHYFPVQAAPSAPLDTVLRVAADPAKGFRYAYFLLVSQHTPKQTPCSLLVEPNNTGGVNDTLAVHERAARQMVAGPQGSLGRSLARALHVPLLVPAFPRPARQPDTYTHALDRDALLASGELQRLDLQLLAMMDDAAMRLRDLQIIVRPQALFNGFSASGTFVNRFALLHPERVRAVAGGGLNGILMLPTGRLNGVNLKYPLGTADFEQVTGTIFKGEQYRQVPQFFYMGALDENDAALYDDAYSKREQSLIRKHLGKKMLPDRWASCQRVYQEQRVSAVFSTYHGIGHETDRQVFMDLKSFFQAHL